MDVSREAVLQNVFCHSKKKCIQELLNLKSCKEQKTGCAVQLVVIYIKQFDSGLDNNDR